MKNKLWQLFITFLKIGAFTFGGGYAMIPIIQKEVVESKKWMSDEDISDIITIAESTPGPIAVNAATFVGYRVAGVLGSALATLGVVLPSFVIILILSLFFEAYREVPIIENAFWGIRIGVIALILNAFLKMFKQCPKKWLPYTLGVLAFLCVLIFNVNALIIILVSALAGIIYQVARGAK